MICFYSSDCSFIFCRQVVALLFSFLWDIHLICFHGSDCGFIVFQVVALLLCFLAFACCKCITTPNLLKAFRERSFMEIKAANNLKGQCKDAGSDLQNNATYIEVCQRFRTYNYVNFSLNLLAFISNVIHLTILSQRYWWGWFLNINLCTLLKSQWRYGCPRRGILENPQRIPPSEPRGWKAQGLKDTFFPHKMRA